METVIITSGNLHGDSHGLPDKAIVKEAQKLSVINPRFWILIKKFRIPYKIVDGVLVEAKYMEAKDGLKSPALNKIYWLLDEEVEQASMSAASMENALKIAEQEIEKLNIFRKD